MREFTVSVLRASTLFLSETKLLSDSSNLSRSLTLTNARDGPYSAGLFVGPIFY
jgi:hypothetical protein